MASKRAVRRRACTGKIHHASEGAAWAAARKTPGTRPYRCSFCGDFHVGHRPGAMRRAVAERRGVAA